VKDFFKVYEKTICKYKKDDTSYKIKYLDGSESILTEKYILELPLAKEEEIQKFIEGQRNPEITKKIIGE
jgi:hypothetical protein